MQFEGCAAEPLRNHHGHFARIQVESLAIAHRVAGCVGRGHKNLSLKLKVFVDDITALVKGKAKKWLKWRKR